LINSFLKSNYAKNVAIILSGNVIAQLIPLLITPIISRLFSVEEFGLFALYSSIASFFMVIAAGRYEMAILLPKDDKIAVNVLALCLLLIFSVAFTLLLIVLALSQQISNLFGSIHLQAWLIWVPLSVVTGAVYRTFTYWSNRKNRYKDTASSTIIQSATRAGINLSGGLIKHSSEVSNNFLKGLFKGEFISSTGVSKAGIGSLIGGYIAGFGLGAVNLIRRFWINDNNLLSSVSWKTIWEQAKNYDKFPKINALHALVDEVKNGGVALLIALFFTEIVLGLYSMTFRVLAMPISVVGSAFGQVFMQNAANQYADKQEILPLINNTIKKLSLIAIPVFLPIILVGPWLFQFVLGAEWRISGEFAQLLSPWLILTFILSPVLQTAIITGHQKDMFLKALIGNLIIFGSIFSGSFFFNNLKAGFILLSTLQILYYFWLYRWIIRLAQDADYQNKANAQ
jgi:O-antigen/teichoic acid export membrane protein